MKQTIARLAFNLKKEPKEIEKLYEYYWKYIKTHIEDLPLKVEDLSEEDFNKLKVNFNIVGLGKFACTYEAYRRLKNKDNYRKKLNNDKSKKSKTDV